jgi:SAM-dependent methyltransferase
MRVFGKEKEIDYGATLEFFDSRARCASPESPQSTTMYQDKSLSEKRDRHESEAVVPLLQLSGGEKILDIGCGYGRWASILRDFSPTYLGIDFSRELLALAEAQGMGFAVFQHMAAQDISPSQLVVPPPFDLVICSGILIYLNDRDVVRLSKALSGLAAPCSTVYLREPMAITGERLTLDRFPSEELKTNYSAIYRTPEQCRELFGTPLQDSGFECLIDRSLYPPELCNRKETEQQIQIWKRRVRQ